MNQSQRRTTTYTIAAFVILLILFVVCRYALREAPPSAQQEPSRTESTKPEPRQAALPDLPSLDEPQAQTPLSQPENPTATNAATIYRQAFALYDALSKDEKGLLVDWRTNVDSSAEADLCDKIRPICDLMHKATSVTNCDWGIEPLTFDTLLPHLSPARGIARAAIWNAAHCRQNDMTFAAHDVLSALRVGQQVSHSALIGCLVDIAIQRMAESYVAANAGLFSAIEPQRLSAAFSDPSYEVEFSLAMEQEANMVERYIPQLASMPADEFEKNISQVLEGAETSKIDRAMALTLLQQVADSRRELEKALASGSADEYEAWQKKSTELQESNPFAKALEAVYERVLDKAQGAAVQRSMMVAALAVAQDGSAALQSHPDPATEKPFVYIETADGFELQSGFKTNGIPLKMQFK